VSVKVWLAARTINYPEAGGVFWVYLNWALGLMAHSCQVTWLELVNPHEPLEKIESKMNVLRHRLEPYGLADSVAICSSNNRPLSDDITKNSINMETSCEADLLINMAYGIPSSVVNHFRRSAFIDIDPGLTQIWISRKQINIANHDVYFTIGETVGTSEAKFPDCGLNWQYSAPCVSLDHWQPHTASAHAPFTTVSNWYMDDWVEEDGGGYSNDKRSGFSSYLEIPKQTIQPLELALRLAGLELERKELQEIGWSVREAYEIASTPQDYQRYIQESRGEFSCVKPSCIRLENAWISDRTLCYLASGKPAIVQHTGQSRFLPDSAGLLRFRNLQEAVLYLEKSASDYEQQCEMARTLAEEYFDAKKVVKQVLEKALA
jgi:hypothetical protein